MKVGLCRESMDVVRSTLVNLPIAICRCRRARTRSTTSTCQSDYPEYVSMHVDTALVRLAYTGACSPSPGGPSPSHRSDRRNPPKHQADKNVKRTKSDIMERRERKTRLSESRLKASRGTRTGAPMASTSSACCFGTSSPVRPPWIRRTAYMA